MLAITSIGALLAQAAPGYRFGCYQIVRRIMQMIAVEFTNARVQGYVDANFTPYHDEICGHVIWALRVIIVCCQQLGGSDALT